MNLRLRILPSVLAFLIAPSVCRISAQTPGQIPSQAPAGLSQSLSNLADQPATHMGFVFDRSMLQAARSLLQAEGLTPERANAALSSISYDMYRYPAPATYSAGAMATVVDAYHAAGWKHLVNAHDLSTANAPRRGPATDLWLHFTGSDIDGVMVLTRGARDMNVVQIACDLRPLDLLRLSGHFGIPKVDPNAVMVPVPDGR